MRKIIVAVLTACLLCSAYCSFRTAEEYHETQSTTPVVTPVVNPAPSPVITPEPTPEPVPLWSEEEVTVLARMLWGEARGVRSVTEQAACVWCVLNRVDQGYGSILEVVTAPAQFVGYRENNPIDETLWLLSEDVLTRWQREKDGETEVGRVLPPNYYFFNGDGKHNHFRTEWKAPYVTWDWSLPSPYES